MEFLKRFFSKKEERVVDNAICLFKYKQSEQYRFCKKVPLYLKETFHHRGYNIEIVDGLACVDTYLKLHNPGKPGIQKVTIRDGSYLAVDFHGNISYLTEKKFIELFAKNTKEYNIDDMKEKKSHRIVTLCGSTKFKEEFMVIQKKLSLEGWVVLSCPFFNHADGLVMSDEETKLLDELHKTKIDISDSIFVVNKDGYIGSSTKGEIEYASSRGKNIMYMEE